MRMLEKLRSALVAKKGVHLTIDDTDRLLEEIKAIEEQVPRRLEPPSYKGVRWIGQYTTADGGYGDSVAAVIYNSAWLSDADWKPLLELREETERQEPVEQVVLALHRALTNTHSCHTSALLDEYLPRVRRAVLRELTAEDHIDALKTLGARFYPNMIDEELRWTGSRNVLILPTEVLHG